MGCTVRVNTVLVMYNDYATVGIYGLIYCMYLYMIYDIYIVCLVCERGVKCQYDDGWSYIWALGTTFFDRIQLYIQDFQDDIRLPHSRCNITIACIRGTVGGCHTAIARLSLILRHST